GLRVRGTPRDHLFLRRGPLDDGRGLGAKRARRGRAARTDVNRLAAAPPGLETLKDCGFVDQRFANVDCGDACSVAEDFAVGCEAEFDAYYGCLADSIDGCTAKDPCLAQSAAFNDCMGD